MAFENETNRPSHMTVRQRILAGLEQLKIQDQRARGAVFERRIPHLDYAPERYIQADHIPGFFHGGKKIFSFPMARLERRHRLAVDIALNVLPITFEILTFELCLKSLECVSHKIILLLLRLLDHFYPELQQPGSEMECWNTGMLEDWLKTHYSIIPSLQYSSLPHSIGLTVIMFVVPAC